jgi:hypothetical protein
MLRRCLIREIPIAPVAISTTYTYHAHPGGKALALEQAEETAVVIAELETQVTSSKV